MTLYDLPWRAALDAAGECIFMTGADLVFTFVNREFERVYGYSAPEVIGRCTPAILRSERTPPEQYAELWERLRRGETVRGSLVNKARDGRLVEVSVIITPIRGPLQDITGYIAVERDLTAELATKSALRRSEDRYGALTAAAPDAVFELDGENRFVYVNRSAAAHLGGDCESLVGQPLIASVPETIVPVAIALLARARESAEPVYDEREIALPGGVRWMSTWVKRIGVETPAHVMGVARDMTKQHTLALLLERERMLFDTIINASPTGILLLNTRTWGCEIANPAVRSLAGPSLLPGVSLAEGWPEAMAGLFPILERALKSDRVVNGDLELSAPLDGSGTSRARHLIVAATQLEAAQHAPSVLVIATDVTEQAELQGQLLQAQKMEAIGRLAGGIAHDFNNLLTPILGYADLVSNSLAPDDRRRHDLDEIRRAAASASALTRQLLTFSRKQLIEPTIVDLNAVLVDVERMLTRAIGEDVELVQQHESGLGMIRADRNQLEQIIMNVGVNARDAMPHGGVLTITTRNQVLTAPASGTRGQIPAGRYVVLSIADTGTGITPEVLGHIFEPFYTTKEFGKGTGLGLSTVYAIVRDSGGYVSVSSAVGEGTTFAFLFPVVEGDAALSRTTHVGAAGPADEMPGGSETILLVEDNDSLRRLAQRVLQPLGYNVLPAASAEDALRINVRTKTPIDLLLTDIIMPGADGLTLSRRLRVQRPSCRVLFMSGYSGTELAARDPRTVGVTLLHKPFTPATLARAVRESLDAGDGNAQGQSIAV